MSEPQPARDDYRRTLNLPKTDFPMRAELPKREPDRVRWWEEHDVYRRRLAANAGNPPFILHDGPPYANGDLHMGHFLNRVLKDAFVKINLLDGRWADFVPGWDMHGLPIERETLVHLGLDFHQVDPLELRAKCRERALYWLDRQRNQMLRMGLFGHFADPYMTIDPRFEGTIVETLADLAQEKQLYKGLRATLWCITDETALAEAEIEYHNHVSPSIYVRFPTTAEQRTDLLRRFGLPEVPGPRVSVAIWTTTPWTLPGNVAIALNPAEEYALLELGDELVVVATALADAFVAKHAGTGGAAVRRAVAPGAAVIGAAARHPFGVAGDESNPFIRRSAPLPMPPTRSFRLGEFFNDATRRLGLHPHPVPVGINTTPYQGRPATTYTAWSNGFGSYTGDKWDPSLSSVPEALATGNLDLRTHCRVVRILTDGDGRVSGAEYIDPNGTSRVQRGRIVILSAYTFESLRLMFLSGDTRHQSGLGNNSGQLGKSFMTKMFAHVNGYFPDVVFNRHTGPAAQGVVIDDFLSAEFDSMQHGFIGGATFGAEQQFLPIQISREALPSDVRRWGKPYKDHVRNWQHYGVVRIQPDTLSYTSNFLDLDPVYRDKSGLGMPVVRITYDMRENEHKLADWMEAKAEEILREMGAVKTWRGQRFTGVGSSHDLGGARMGNDPSCSVVSPDLEVHDTPGLYVYGGATFPTCPGINPTLTLWAVCYRAADCLVKRLKRGEGA